MELKYPHSDQGLSSFFSHLYHESSLTSRTTNMLVDGLSSDEHKVTEQAHWEHERQQTQDLLLASSYYTL